MPILLEIFAVAIVAIFVAKLVAPSRREVASSASSRCGSQRVRSGCSSPTPYMMEDGSQVVAGRLVLDTLQHIDAGTFWTFMALAAGIKFVGLLASMYRWLLLLRGQAIELPVPTHLRLVPDRPLHRHVLARQR